MQRLLPKLDTLQLRRYWRRGVRRITPPDAPSLTPEQQKATKDFFRPWFKPDLATHRYLQSATGEFHPDWIPYDEEYCRIDPFFNDWKKSGIYSNKCFLKRFLKLEETDVPGTVCYRANGIWFDGSERTVKAPDALALISSQKEVFIKAATDSCGGHGVVHFTPPTSQNADYQRLKDILNQFKGDIIVQLPVVQSSSTAKFNPSSLNTIRLMTLLTKDGEVIPLSAVLRMGTGGRKVDNLHSGGLVVGLTEAGELRERAFNLKAESFTSHPATCEPFKGNRLPTYDQLLAKAKTLHPRLPYFRLISWDFALNADDRPILIEANLASGGIDVHQLANGPVFGKNVKEVLAEVYQHVRPHK